MQAPLAEGDDAARAFADDVHRVDAALAAQLEASAPMDSYRDVTERALAEQGWDVERAQRVREYFYGSPARALLPASITVPAESLLVFRIGGGFRALDLGKRRFAGCVDHAERPALAGTGGIEEDGLGHARAYARAHL